MFQSNMLYIDGQLELCFLVETSNNQFLTISSLKIKLLIENQKYAFSKIYIACIEGYSNFDKKTSHWSIKIESWLTYFRLMLMLVLKRGTQSSEEVLADWGVA
jgi:hypothetical protein